jgi:plasmid stabilization system protein ParE
MIEYVVYTEEAEYDVVSHYRWYEDREPGLGEDFLRCVEACVLGIQRNPRLYPIVVDDFRRGLVRRFPFEIFYELTEDSIVVYSVFHSSQDPQKWRNRLDR